MDILFKRCWHDALIWSNEFGVTKGCVLEERYVKFVKKVTEIFELLLYNGRLADKTQYGIIINEYIEKKQYL